MKQNIIDRINHLADEKEPFLFVVNYAGSEAYIRKLSEIATDECLYDFEGITNVKRQSSHSLRLPNIRRGKCLSQILKITRKALKLSKATSCVETVILPTLLVRWLWTATLRWRTSSYVLKASIRFY